MDFEFSAIEKGYSKREEGRKRSRASSPKKSKKGVKGSRVYGFE